MEEDSQILELALKAVTAKFSEFIGECMDENGKPKSPCMRSLMQARACLPGGTKHAFEPKKRQ